MISKSTFRHYKNKTHFLFLFIQVIGQLTFIFYVFNRYVSCCCMWRFYRKSLIIAVALENHYLRESSRENFQSTLCGQPRKPLPKYLNLKPSTDDSIEALDGNLSLSETSHKTPTTLLLRTCVQIQTTQYISTSNNIFIQFYSQFTLKKNRYSKDLTINCFNVSQKCNECVGLFSTSNLSTKWSIEAVVRQLCFSFYSKCLFLHPVMISLCFQ